MAAVVAALPTVPTLDNALEIKNFNMSHDL